MDDLWGKLILDDAKIEDSKAINILREQARLLEKKTYGKIKATFSKLNYKTTTSEVIGQAISSFADIKEEIVDPELKGKKDFNEIYNFTKYKFELYNDIYRFRVFILNYRPVFPIEIEVDEGIKEELNIPSKKSIYSDDELRELVSAIFLSSKIKMIIKRMYAQK